MNPSALVAMETMIFRSLLIVAVHHGGRAPRRNRESGRGQRPRQTGGVRCRRLGGRQPLGLDGRVPQIVGSRPSIAPGATTLRKIALRAAARPTALRTSALRTAARRTALRAMALRATALRTALRATALRTTALRTALRATALRTTDRRTALRARALRATVRRTALRARALRATVRRTALRATALRATLRRTDLRTRALRATARRTLLRATAFLILVAMLSSFRPPRIGPGNGVRIPSAGLLISCPLGQTLGTSLPGPGVLDRPGKGRQAREPQTGVSSADLAAANGPRLSVIDWLDTELLESRQVFLHFLKLLG